MIQFREKKFAAPLLAALGSTTGLGLMTAGGVGLSAWQGSKQQKEMERANEEQAELIREQNRKLNKIAEAQKEGKPIDGEALQGAMQKGFAAPASFIKEGKLFLKDMGKLAYKHKDHLAAGAAIGASMGLATYGANKYIQSDMKKQGLTETMTGQKSYSVGSFAVKTLKANKKSMLLMGTGLGAVPTVLGYEADKKQIKNQIDATTPKPEQRAYANASGIIKSISQGFKNFWKTPGRSTLSGLSSLTMGGGQKGVQSVGQDLVKNGQSKWTKKLGSFMLDKNGNASKKGLALSIPVGVGVMTATWDVPQKAIEKTTRAMDKKAYAYQDSKNQQI